jgi:hypothetical protein
MFPHARHRQRPSECHDLGDLEPALDTAARHAAEGGLALVSVPVADTDVPPGVLHLYGVTPTR